MFRFRSCNALSRFNLASFYMLQQNYFKRNYSQRSLHRQKWYRKFLKGFNWLNSSNSEVRTFTIITRFKIFSFKYVMRCAILCQTLKTAFEWLAKNCFIRKVLQKLLHKFLGIES